jgi:hypothetical protein
MSWRDNDEKLRPLLVQSALLQEDVELSKDLSALGAAGLESLDYLDKPQIAPDSWRTTQVALIEKAKKRNADLLLMVAAPVGELVDATGRPR